MVFSLIVVVLVGHVGIDGFISAGAPLVAQAAFNAQINYQGKLTNASNVAVPDGTYHMKFWLLTSATAATTTAIWTEDRSTVAGNRITVTDGLFSVMLGSSTPLTNIDFNQTLYLGVEVGGSGGSPLWDGEMSPRKVLGAVPAAFEAGRLDGISSEQFFRNDSTNATSSATTSLSVAQYGAGKIAEFFGTGGLSAFSILSTGYVGIGTSTPNASLDIDSSLSYLGGYQGAFRPAISSGSIGDEIGLITNDDRLISAYMTGTDKFFYGTNDGLTGLVVDGSSGYVGIGTSSPEVSLDVWGTGAYLGDPTGGTARLYAGTANDSVGAGNETGIWAHDSVYGTQQIAIFDNDLNWQYGGSLNAPGIFIKNVDAATNPLAVGIGGFITPGSMLSVKGNGAIGDTYSSINAPTDGLIVEGKVGFGTSSPFSRFSLQGPSASATTSLFAVASSTKQTLFNILASGNVGVGTSSPYTNFSVAGQSASSYFSAFTTTSTSTFAGGLTAASSLYALQNGNVGVGIAAPTSKFHVSGGSATIENAGAVNLTINDSSNSQVPNISLRQNGTQKAFIEGGVGLSSRLDLGTGASTRVITINSSSVGISEQSPASKLSVSGNGSYGTTYDTIAAPTNGLIVEGNVGVGTSSPFSKLSVQTTSSAGSTSLFAVASSTNATLFNVLGNGKVGVGTTSPFARLSIQNNDTTPAFVINTNSSTFVVASNGSLGFNTLTPNYTIDLNGTSLGSSGGAVLIDASSNDSTGVIQLGDVNGAGNAALLTIDDSSTYHYAFDNLVEAGGGEYFACIKTDATRHYLLWGTTCDSSTRTVKENISALDGQSSLERLMSLNPVEFNYKPGYYNGKRDIGFIAEDVSQVDPRYALYNEAGREVNINVRAILSDTVKSVQEIAQRISINDAPTTSPSLTINTSGNVGIGVNDSLYKLQVSGDVGARGFVAKADQDDITNVNKLQEEDLVAFANKLTEIDISTFRFNDETGTPNRLGILASDAPSEILTANGDVDVYKLSVFNLGVAKAQQLRLDSIEERLAAVESQIRIGNGGGGLWSNPFQTLEDFGISFSESVAKFKNVLVGELIVGSSEKPTGITLYDEATGKPYCVKIIKGKLKNFAGECGQNSNEEIPNDGRDAEPVAPSIPTTGDTAHDVSATLDVSFIDGVAGDLKNDVKNSPQTDVSNDSDQDAQTQVEPSRDNGNSVSDRSENSADSDSDSDSADVSNDSGSTQP